ncbi:MAG: urate hydroxylase PuuD [Flavobacteriales bacterium]|nr:urate hydroxylase PuuD [Flavobacteriales bacterium]
MGRNKLIFSFLIFFSFTLLFNNVLADSLSVDTVISPDSLALSTEIIATGLPEISKPSFLDKLISDDGLPFVAIAILLLLIAYSVYSPLVDYLNKTKEESGLSDIGKYETEDAQEASIATKGTLKYLAIIIGLGYLTYIGVKDSSMQGFVMEWLNLIVRWFHVVAGVMWIGASFYFIFLENNLNRTKGIRDELAGNLWAVHGGGFYFLEKYKVAPKEIPEDLHWFKYEAYFTWLSGFFLLFIVYYMDAKAFLIDPSIADISSATAIGIGIGILIFGYVIYDLMCRSRLSNNQGLFAIVGFVVLTAIAYFLTEVFNPRAAYIHVGALIGTIMVGNVYFTIIPAQKAMVKAAKTGGFLDESLGKKAGQRSLHNNYFTLPVIFIMISNHFPSTFGHEFNWIVLMVISLASAGIKHYWNLIEQGVVKKRILWISVIGLLSLALVTSPFFEDTMDNSIPVSFEEANEVIQTRCVQCHSSSPTDDQWTTAPNGVMYDTPEQIKAMADKIMIRAVRTKTMPQGNKTNMTDNERVVLKRWILQGAKIDSSD